MKLVTHGGRCCGVKIIHSLMYSPDNLAYELVARDKPWGPFDHGVWEYKNPGVDFFFDAAPKETYLERFRRYVEYCKEERSKGMIEVTISSSQTPWASVLLGEGFNLVTQFRNSNSGLTVYIYHLVYGQE